MRPPTATVIRPEDPCPCGSELTWKACCGSGLNPYGVLLDVTGVQTHHFFVIDHSTGQMLCDAESAVIVWTDRARATRAGNRLWPERVIATIGMGDEKWERFQREMRWVKGE